MSDDENLREFPFGVVNLTEEIKRKHWGEGPWVTEPNYERFSHNGIHCVVRRVAAWEGPNKDHLFGGHLCGYVQIPEKLELNLDIDEYENFDVHGGITFNDVFSNGRWIGFDCAHSFDLTPSLSSNWKNMMIRRPEFAHVFPEDFIFPKPTYKNWDYVVEETKRLANQVAENA